MQLNGDALRTWITKYGLTRDKWDELRQKCKTDLFTLCKVIGLFDVTEFTHKEVCDHFVPKDSVAFPDFRDFALADSDLHFRDLFLPRGGFKSSIDSADCIQWIINWPNITILILTGTYRLSRDFVKEIRTAFTFADEGGQLKPRTLRNGKPSLFQVLFPEFCVPPREGTELEYSCPLKTFGKEPSVRASSIEQALSGFHYDIMKLDDVVTNENCTTTERRQSVRRQIEIAGEMLNPYGYFDKIGTWYDEDDAYGHEILDEEKRAINGEPPTVKILLRPAMWPKPEAVGKPEEQMLEEDWVLWFPERLTYTQLVRERTKKPQTFASQKMNNPRLFNLVRFTREEMVKATLPITNVPTVGAIFSAWDTAYKTNAWNDYTVGMIGLFNEGKIFIVDMVRGRYGPFDLPRMIASTLYRWKPSRSVIEDSNGVGLLEREIWRECRMVGSSAPLELQPLGKGQKGVTDKMSKAKLLARLLFSGRLFFSSSCTGLEDIYEELERFGSSRGHDDIVCALSLLVNRFAGSLDAQIAESEATTLARNASMRQWHDRIYPKAGYDASDSNWMFGAIPEPAAYSSGQLAEDEGYSGLPSILGDLEG
jgi:phage terminase large subunit-like protein